MKKQPNKIYAMIVAILMLSSTAFILITPSAKASGNVPSYAFITVSPNPTGIGQQVLVETWLSDPPPTAAGPTGDRWQGLMLTITHPDGTNETIGPYNSDDVGGQYHIYTPTAAGTYYFQFSFPGQTISATGNYYQPVTSARISLTVQQQQLTSWPSSPLPTNYWTRPINGQNREWAPIAGNWLMAAYNQSARSFDAGSAFDPYTTAPNSAHIVWTKPLEVGGLVGGSYGSESYYAGMSYEQPFNPPIIINGVLYYNTPNPPRYGITAVDIRTGQTLWFTNNTAPVQDVPPPATAPGSVTTNYIPLTLGQIYAYDSPNQHGALPYLWSIWSNSLSPGAGIPVPNAHYDMYDARTGNWILSLVNGTIGTPVYADDGSILVYILDAAHNWLALWNSSLAIPPAYSLPTGSGYWQWRPGLNATILPWSAGIQWNTTIAAVPVGAGGSPQAISKIGSGIVLATATAPNPSIPIFPGSATFPGATYIFIGYDANTGNRLWIQNETNLGTRLQIGPTSALIDNIFFAFVRETLQWYSFSTSTGLPVWSSPTAPYVNNWGFYSTGTATAYGNFYTSGYDGTIHCFNLATGANTWNFYDGPSTYAGEVPYGQYPFYGGITIADNKIFAANGEHSPSQPFIRGESLYAIDATSGKQIWTMNGWFIANSIVLSDGYLIADNQYDNRLYAFGKGQTATTVSVTQSQITKGGIVGITGSVTDQSPAQPGTPAVSDNSMSAWMAYLNEQQPKPTNTTGVQVTLTAIASDGTVVPIGQATTDSNGVYRFQWTPLSQDLYEIAANFGGTNSYWSSQSTTALMVGPAASPSVTTSPSVSPSTTPTTTPSTAPVGPTPSNNTYLIIAAAAVAIVIVAIAATVVLRKRTK